MEDFIIRQLPELVSNPTERDAIIRVIDIKSEWDKDELNKNKIKLEITFSLPKGVYATMLLKKLSLNLKN